MSSWTLSYLIMQFCQINPYLINFSWITSISLGEPTNWMCLLLISVELYLIRALLHFVCIEPATQVGRHLSHSTATPTQLNVTAGNTAAQRLEANYKRTIQLSSCKANEQPIKRRTEQGGSELKKMHKKMENPREKQVKGEKWGKARKTHIFNLRFNFVVKTKR